MMRLSFHPRLRPRVLPRRLFALLALGLIACAAGAVGVASAADAAGATSPPEIRPGIPTDAQGLPLWLPRVWNDFPVRLELPGPAALAELLARVPIADFDREQVRPVRGAAGAPRALVLETRVTEAEHAALLAAGYAPVRVRDLEREGRQAVESAWAAQAAAGGAALKAGEKGTYHTYAQIGELLQQAAANYPAIAQAGSIGSSVQGRSLWSLRLSDNVGVNEAEPEVRLAGTIHGNELPAQEMLLLLVDYLTVNYGVDPIVTSIVDNTDLTIIPCLNPDGLVAGTRQNANGYDLNRNFPVPDGSIGDDGTWTEQAETIAFKSHAAARHFAVSQVGHTGTLVVNYPWDHTYDLTPDDAAIQLLSLEYSRANPPMYESYEFPQGITNGAQWYVVKGSLQDWAYHATGCVDLTIEICGSHLPPAGYLDQLWLDNRQSLLNLIQAAHYGIHGVVTDSSTSQPLAATVTVAGNGMPVTTDPAAGDYYKLLPTGTYDLTFTAEGHQPRTVTGVATTWGTPTVLDVQLAAPTGAETPLLLSALRAQPNPFNPHVELAFSLSRPGRGGVAIHDARGRLVRRLPERALAAGDASFAWDGADGSGRLVESGVYFARLSLNGRAVQTVKMTLAR